MSPPSTTTPLHERLIWVVVACLAWRFAGLASSVGIYRAGAGGVALAVLATTFGLAALVVAVSRRASRWASGPHLFVAFTFFFVVFGIVDAFSRAHTAYTWSTDAHAFGDYAARLLMRGRNPYDASLSGAFSVMRLPIELQTPLVDGGFSDRLAYPSLSFLVLVPFVKAGIDTRFAFATAVWACTAVLYFNVPRVARPIVLVPFFADPTYLYFAFGGVTDGIWALLLCFVVIHWKNRDRAAVLFGLACCVKQHPWLLAPFLAVRLWQETEGDRKVLLRFVGIAAGVFLITNLPFIAWSPHAWLQGVVEPLVRRMVPLGDGPTAFVALAGLPVPRPIFTVAFWGALLLLLAACARLPAGRILLWIAPSLAFFLNHRSLSTYWYFNVFPFAVELARTDWSALTARAEDRDDSRTLRRLAYAGGAFVAVLLVSAIVLGRMTSEGLDVAIDIPMRTWSGRIHRVDLRVTNRSAKVVTPRFWGQSASFQPLTWKVDDGPTEIAPGQTALFSISATHTIAEIETDRGGTLTVTDRDSALRKAIPVVADPASLSPRAIPNAALRFWDVHTGSPTWWTLARSGAPAGRARPVTVAGRRGVELVVDSDRDWAKKNELQFCLAIPSCWAESKASAVSFADLDTTAVDHRVELVTDFVNRDRRIAVWAFPPRDANRAPFEELYGVMLSFASKDVMVLLGSDAGRGTLPSGIPFESLPGAPDVWGRYEIDLAGLRERYAPDVYPRSHPTLRLPFLDLPLIGVKLRYVYSTCYPDKRSVTFGPVEDPLDGRDDRDDVMRELDAHPGQVDLWRARYEWDFGNPDRAAEHIARARAAEKHPEIELRAAELAKFLHHPGEAREAYENILARAPVPANLGLGWLALAERKHAVARDHFQAALDVLAREPQIDGEEELHRLNALVGIAITRAALGDCRGAVASVRELPEGNQEKLLDGTVPEITDCAKREGLR